MACDIYLLEPSGREEVFLQWREKLPSRETLYRSFGPHIFDLGLDLFEEQAVRQIWFGPEHIKGRIGRGQGQEAIWQVTPQSQLFLHCTCRRRAYCEHQIALVLTALKLIETAGPASNGRPLATVENGNNYVRLQSPDAYTGRILEDPLRPAPLDDRSLLSQNGAANGAPESESRRYRLFYVLHMRNPGLGLEILVESPKIAREARPLFSIMQMFKSVEKRETARRLVSRRPAQEWEEEDIRVLRFLESIGKTTYTRHAMQLFTVPEFTDLLALLAGHPRLLDHEGQTLRVSSHLLTPRLEGAWTEANGVPALKLRPRLKAGGEAVEAGKLFLLDGRLKWWFDGHEFFLHDHRYAPGQIVAAAQGQEFAVEGLDRILTLLQQQEVTIVGDRPEIRVEKGVARLWVGLEESELVLQAEIRSCESDRVWFLPRNTRKDAEEGGYVLCDPELAKEVEGAVREADFEPDGGPGRHRAGLERLDDLVEKHLPRWRERYQVELDGALAELLEGKRQVRPRISASWDGGIDWFELKWDLEAGDELLGEGDRKALRHFRGKYFRLKNGRVVSVDSGALGERLDELEEMSPTGQGRVHLHFLALLAEQAERPEGSVELSKELQALSLKLRQFERVEPVDPPKKLRNVLRPYQREGLDFLNFLSEYHLGGVLADDMGLGKTLQALALLELDRRKQGRAPSLVVCPTSVAPNWLEEAAKFTPALKTIHLRTSPEVRSCDFNRYDLVVLTYGLVRRNLLEQDFRYVILDEAQNIKNPLTQNARSVKQLRTRHRLALSGTPIENCVLELWSLFDFLMPGMLGNLHRFQTRYAAAIAQRGDRHRLEALSRRVRPFILRRLKAQVAPELPKKTEQNIYCDLTPTQKKLYARVAAEVRQTIDREIGEKGWDKSQICVLTALLRLRQICCHPALLDKGLRQAHSGKQEAFLELLESILSGGHRVLVFSQFVEMLKILRRELDRRKVRYLYLDGQTRERQTLVRTFQERATHPVFLMSLKAGGTGINLTAADYVVLYDPWWNPAVENQAIDRTHRIGQDKNITAYRMIARGTVEEKMLLLKERKKDLADRVLASESDFFRRLTREDLDTLLDPRIA